MSILTIILTAAKENPWDVVGLVIFVLCWSGYEPLLQRIGKKVGVIVKDLSVVRRAWMKEMTIRGFKLYDSNLIGHAVNSATHFSSANLILIAAITGVLFGGHLAGKPARELGIDLSSPLLVQIKLALVVICLSRGLLNFTWCLRQINYCAAAMGSLPENLDDVTADKFSDAMFHIMDPAMSNFSKGVRGYYFSLAAGAWLFGPVSLILASLGAVALLGWRQSRSEASQGIRALRELLETHPYPTQTRPILNATAQNSSENAAVHKEQLT